MAVRMHASTDTPACGKVAVQWQVMDFDQVRILKNVILFYFSLLREMMKRDNPSSLQKVGKVREIGNLYAPVVYQ